MLVHIGRGSILGEYVPIPCVFDEHLVSRLDRKRLLENWRSYPGPPELQRLGAEWVKGGDSAVLELRLALGECRDVPIAPGRRFPFVSGVNIAPTMSIDLTRLSEDELLDLNRRIVERLRLMRSARQLVDLARFTVGMRVEFTTEDGRTLQGEITRLNRRTATVCCNPSG